MVNVNVITIFLLFIVVYLFLYFNGRRYLERFQGADDYNGQPRFNKDGTPRTDFTSPTDKKDSPTDKKYAARAEPKANSDNIQAQKDNCDSCLAGLGVGTCGNNKMVYPPEKPWLSNPINDLDDYEMSVVYQNQGSKTASKKQISDAMTRYPMDWSVQGPASQHFQDKEVQFEKNVVNSLNNPPATGFYKEIDGSDMTPPDMEAQAAEEKKILQTYKPECSKGLLEYSVDDVKSLIDKVYTKKGLVPVIEKSKQGENVWEIVEVNEKDPHIVWEDELEKETQRQKMEKRGEEVIEVPYTAQDVAVGLDPFFQARNSTRDQKYNYYQWTPGLQRMFAPTYPIKEWF